MSRIPFLAAKSGGGTIERRHGARVFGAILAAVAGVILVGLYHDAPGPAAWPWAEYFRCRDCGGPASIDPDQPERWGCRACGFSTWRLFDRFYCATQLDFTSQAAYIRAARVAGIIGPADAGPTLLDLYRQSRGWL